MFCAFCGKKITPGKVCSNCGKLNEPLRAFKVLDINNNESNIVLNEANYADDKTVVTNVFSRSKKRVFCGLIIANVLCVCVIIVLLLTHFRTLNMPNNKIDGVQIVSDDCYTLQGKVDKHNNKYMFIPDEKISVEIGGEQIEISEMYIAPNINIHNSTMNTNITLNGRIIEIADEQYMIMAQ